jgi:hypothetical protein
MKIIKYFTYTLATIATLQISAGSYTFINEAPFDVTVAAAVLVKKAWAHHPEGKTELQTLHKVQVPPSSTIVTDLQDNFEIFKVGLSTLQNVPGSYKITYGKSEGLRMTKIA